MRRGRSEECLMLVDEGIWNRHLETEERSSDFSRNRRYRSLTLDAAAACEQQNERRHKAFRNKYNFKEDAKKRAKKTERTEEDAVEKVETAWKMPTTEKWKIENWSRTQSAENIKNLESQKRLEEEKIISDESGISSGDENNNTIIDSEGKREIENYSFVSVREKKKFFESLSSDAEGSASSTESAFLTRSNSIGDLKKGSDESTKLRRRKRTKSLHDLSRSVPVREICRLFEPQSEDMENGAIEEEVEGNVAEGVTEREASTEKNAIIVLNQRRLQRGERRLARLRVHISEVEETIKVIAEDLASLGTNTLKR